MTEHNQATILTGALRAARAERPTSAEPIRAQKEAGSGWAFFLGLAVIELAWLLLLAYLLYRVLR